MVSAKGFVGGKIGTVAIVAGLIIGAALLSKKFDVGNTITDSLRGFGSGVGQSITAPFQGIVEGLTAGGEGLGNSALDLSEGLQKSISSTLGGGFNVFSNFGQGSGGGSVTPAFVPSRNTGSNVLDIGKFFSTDAIENRINNAIGANTPQGIRTTGTSGITGTLRDLSPGGFGGFGSAVNQETALQKAIAESREANPQFFT